MRNGVQYGVDTADVLSTVAECDASASGGKGTTQVASAKALSELNSKLGWLSHVETVSSVGAQTVTFSNLDTSKAYELWFETTDGSQVKLISSSLNGTTMTYIVDIPLKCPVPVNFKLRKIM